MFNSYSSSFQANNQAQGIESGCSLALKILSQGSLSTPAKGNTRCIRLGNLCNETLNPKTNSKVGKSVLKVDLY